MLNKNYNQLTLSQKKAVLHKKGPLLVLAGPGSGKTRVITYRIAALVDSGIRPHNILAITFTNKAAEEMRQRAFSLGTCRGAHISTFHSLCVRILRQYAQQADIKPNFSIYDAADQIRAMRKAVKDCELDTTNFSPARMLDVVSALKNNLVDVNTFKTQADDFFSKALAKVYTRYQQILSQRNALDFDDLLMKTASLIETSTDVSSRLSERFKFLLIDEYQDTNHAQYRIAKALASSHNNICVTGDPDQSIYRWRGADIRNILAFENDWPEACVVKLEENFRSTPNILEIADKLIATNRNRKIKKLIPTKSPGRDIIITAFEDETEEAQGIAQQIEELISRGSSRKDIAVFYRVNSASRILEEALIYNKIPYQIVRGTEFYSRKEVRDLLAYLKILVNPDDQAALTRIINTPARGIGKTTIDRIQSFSVQNKITFFQALKKTAEIQSLSNAPKAKIAVFINMLEQFKKYTQDNMVAPLAEKVFIESGLKKSLQNAGELGLTALENIAELVNAAAKYDKQNEQPSLLDYLQQISLFSDADSYDNSTDRVALMTLHAAKGLEFENVFITGLEEGLLPHERSSDNDDETEEERRLFFVGITRAKTELFISYARYRTIRGRMLRAIPSPFLYEIGVDFIEQTYPFSSSENENQINQFEDDFYQDEPQFIEGQLVKHKKFGLGRIQNFTDMGENSIVTIKFNSGQTKTLMLKYAQLMKVE